MWLIMVGTETNIRTELRCGDLGRIVTLHGETYEPLGGYGLKFEAYVARTIAEFILDNAARGRIWLAERDGVLVGCAAVALRAHGRGQLRWVVVDPSLRGQGLGKRLVIDAIRYCEDAACTSIFLNTTDGLPESQGLYESLGFRVTSEVNEELWDGVRPLIVMEKSLA